MSTVHTGNTPGTALGANDQDLAPGQEVGEYRIESVLGQGGFGTVYAAVHPLIGKRAAIKVLARKYSADPGVVSRFVAEARAVNQIRHRNIIDIFSFGQLADGRHYYVMEYLEGMPLDAYLKERGPLPLAEALPILRAIARALDAAHAKGIAHRDLKPENIFLAQDADEMYPKLLDFGIAKLMAPEEDVRHRTGTGVPIGTPYYMSPEQCRGREVDHRTDMYSFGIVAYRMLTGTFPFESEDYVDLLYKQVNEEPAPPSTKTPGLPTSADNGIAWMMQKDREKRPPTVLEGVLALDPDATHTPSIPPITRNRGSKPSMPPKRQVTPDALAKTTAPDQLLGTAATMAEVTPAPTLPPVAGAAKSRMPLFALLALLVLGCGAAAAVLVFGKKTAKPDKADVTIMTFQAGDGSAHAGSNAPAAPIADAPAVAPTPDHVIITIEGAPDGSKILRGGELVGTAPKIELAYSTKEQLLLVQTPGYEPTSLSVVPDADKSVIAKLVKKAHTQVTHQPHTDTTTEQPDKDDLADPFKKRPKPPQ